ncbi:MAG: DoxX family membrane protein [Pseudonocardiaceae bacterium]
MLVRRAARPLLAVAFVSQGVDTLLNPKSKIEATRPLLDKAQRVVPAAATVDPLLVVRTGGAVKVGAGLMMACGKAPRLAAALLAADLIPSTAAEYPFTSAGHPDARKTQRAQFLQNCALLGGLLLAMADTGGKPSLAWRARHAKKDAEKGVSKLSRRVRKRTKHALD